MDQYRQSSYLKQKFDEAIIIVGLCSVPLVGVLIWIGYNKLKTIVVSDKSHAQVFSPVVADRKNVSSASHSAP